MAYFTEALALSGSAFALLRDLIQERLGLYYGEDRRDLLRDRLAPLAAERNASSFLDYYYMLKYGEDAREEWRRVQTALAVRETYFWREMDQIRLVARTLAPVLLARNPHRPLRIWHAACATGEEPYTMAIALQEEKLCDGRVEIVGTDFDGDALALARTGMFRERSFRALPPELRQRYFTERGGGGVGVGGGGAQINVTIRGQVRFVYLNLADEEGMRQMREYDIVFCRNCFIYFGDAAIQAVTQRLYEALRSPGYLMLGASESLLRFPSRFRFQEMDKSFVYVKDV